MRSWTFPRQVVKDALRCELVLLGEQPPTTDKIEFTFHDNGKVTAEWEEE